MSKDNYAGTVISFGPNKDKDGAAVPGGNMLVDFKVKNNLALMEPTLIRIRISNQEAWDYMTQQNLGKGATVAAMASGIHGWQEGRDGVLKAQGDKPARPIHRFLGLDLDTVYVAAGAVRHNTETTRNPEANRGVASIVSALAGAAMATLEKVVGKPAATTEDTFEEVKLDLPEETPAS